MKKNDPKSVRYDAFIERGRQQMSLLGVHLSAGSENLWSSIYWNVYSSLQNPSSTVARRSAVLWFSTQTPPGGSGDFAKKAKSVTPFKELYEDFAKAFVVNWFADRTTVRYAALYNILDVLRALYGELPAKSPDPKVICLEHFLQVERNLIRRWELPESDRESLSHASARSRSEVLQTVGTLFDSLGILPSRIEYNTQIPLQRRERVDRHADPFKERKERLFPEPDIFYFLADLANRSNLDPYWRFRLRAIELQVALGRRISEILLLPKDCLVFGKNNSIGVRYFPRKGADPFVAWVPRDKHFESASQIVQRAVEDIHGLGASARQRAKLLETCNEPEDMPLAGYAKASWRSEANINGLEDPDNYMIASEFAEVFGVPAMHYTSFLKAREIEYTICKGVVPRYEKLGPRSQERDISSLDIQSFRARVLELLDEWRVGRFGKWLTFRHLEWQLGTSACLIRKDSVLKEAFIQAANHLAARCPEHQPVGTWFAVAKINDIKRSLFSRVHSDLQINVYPGEPPVVLSELLFVVFQREMDRSRATNIQLPQLLKVNQIHTFLKGSRGTPSVFDAFGRSELRAKSHGFRRWVTTEGRRAGINNLVLARWMGRTAPQNDVYDYNGPEVFTESNLGVPLDLSRIYGSVRDLMEDMEQQGVPLAQREKFLAAEMQGFIITDKGGCSHEWAVTPCQKARACYNGCPEYYVVKGRKDHYERAIKERLAFERVTVKSGVWPVEVRRLSC